MEDERIRHIMGKLYAKASLTGDELSELQTHVDQLETLGRAAGSHHHSHTTPNSHHSHHVTTVADVAGILEQVNPRK
jgi:hypothetical protein